MTLLSAPLPARASLTLTLTLTADGQTVVVNMPSTFTSRNGVTTYTDTFNGNVGNFNVNASATASDSATLGQINSGQISVINGGDGTDTLTMTVTAGGFTTPTAPIEYLNSNFQSSNPGSGPPTSLTLASSLTQSNGQSVYLGSQSVNSSYSTQFTRVPGTFSLANQTVLTLAADDQVQGTETTSATLTQAPGSVLVTPEPATLAASLAGLPIVGLFCYLRRRRATPA